MGEEGTQMQATERLGMRAIFDPSRNGLFSYVKTSPWSSSLRATAGIVL